MPLSSDEKRASLTAAFLHGDAATLLFTLLIMRESIRDQKSGIDEIFAKTELIHLLYALVISV